MKGEARAWNAKKRRQAQMRVHVCALTHATDVSVESDVVEAELACLDLAGILHAEVALCVDVCVAEGCVVIEENLGVDAEHLSVLGLHEGVDLHLRGLLLDEQLVEVLHLLLRLGDLCSLESEQLGDALGVGVLHPLVDVDGLRVDQVGGVVGDGLDVHAALRRRNEHGAVVRAVEQDGEVQLAVEVDALVDENLERKGTGKKKKSLASEKSKDD